MGVCVGGVCVNVYVGGVSVGVCVSEKCKRVRWGVSVSACVGKVCVSVCLLYLCPYSTLSFSHYSSDLSFIC